MTPTSVLDPRIELRFRGRCLTVSVADLARALHVPVVDLRGALLALLLRPRPAATAASACPPTGATCPTMSAEGETPEGVRSGTVGAVGAVSEDSTGPARRAPWDSTGPAGTDPENSNGPAGTVPNDSTGPGGTVPENSTGPARRSGTSSLEEPRAHEAAPRPLTAVEIASALQDPAGLPIFERLLAQHPTGILRRALDLTLHVPTGNIRRSRVAYFMAVVARLAASPTHPPYA
jgi:hypothetical protein